MVSLHEVLASLLTTGSIPYVPQIRAHCRVTWLLSYTGSVIVIHVAAVCSLQIVIAEAVNDCSLLLGLCSTSAEVDEL